MNNIKKYFSLNGEMTGREWVMMKVVQFVVFILIFIAMSFIFDGVKSFYAIFDFYTNYVKSGPVLSLLEALSFIALPMLAIFFTPLLICNAWVEIVSAIKRCRAMGTNPILELAILHIGFALHFALTSVTLGVLPSNIYHYLVLGIVLLTLFLQYRFFGIDKNKNAQP